MHLRKLTLTVGLVGALCSTWAYGLGLGGITLNSTLNQPLDAEIKLLQVRNLTEEDIVVALAAAEDFQRFGVDRIFFLQNLKFDVQLDHPGGPIVRVTSDEPVREPYLVFLLEAESPGGGRLLREYTLLVDLPVYADEPAQPVQGVQTRPAPQQAQSPRQAPQQSRPQEPQPSNAQVEPARAQEAPPRAEPAPQRSVSAEPGVEVYGPVQANDTLWEIAQRVRPNSSVSVQQTMLALQRSNPEAFINGNINLLKRGQVLRVPSQSEFEALDQRAAVGEVASQNDRWSADRDGQISGAELRATPSRQAAPTEEQAPRGQLTLAAPGNAESAGERSGAGDTSARTEALENELAISAEELDASRRENQELSTRVAELEEQIATMERLIEVSSEELRAMQLAAEQGQAAANDTVAEADQGAAANEAAPDTENVSAANASEEPPQPVAQPSKTVTPQVQAPQPSLLDLLMANLWYLLIAILAILGGVVYFLHRRNQEELQSFEAEEDELFADMDEQDIDPENLEESAGFDQHLDFGEDDQPAFEEEEVEPELPVEAETADAVGEADIYIAYGKFDQAEEMLQKAILNEPNNVDARLKLLEVYSETKDIENFDLEYGQLMGMGDAGATARAAQLRAAIPDAGQFEGTGQFDGGADSDELQFGNSEQSDVGESLEFSSDEHFSLDDDSLDASELSLDAEEAPNKTSHAESEGADPAESDFDGLTLDLDDDLGDFSLGGDKKPGNESAEADEDISFEFDLDLEDEGELDLAEADEDAETAEKSGDFDLDLDLGEDLEMGSASVEEAPVSKQDVGGLEFNLDLDSPSLDEAQESEKEVARPTLSEGEPEEDIDFSLDLDLEESEESDGSELNLDLGENLFSADTEDDASNAKDDIFSDLEFSTSDGGKAAEPEATEKGEEAVPTLQLEAGDDADDDFDMDLGDLDLEALDQEMDALVGGVDDPSDDDLALASPVKAAPGLAEKSSATALDDFDFDNLATAELDSPKSASAELDGTDLDSPDWSMPEAKPTSDSLESFEFGEDQDFGQEQGVDEDLDSELDFLSDADEVATKLDLARAYIDMGDQEGAKDILDEVVGEGNDEQKREAADLLEKIV